jgi:hypothetical protein
VFLPTQGFEGSFGFQGIEVLGVSHDMPLYIGGHYSCRTGAIVYNLTVKGSGAICRYCLGGTNHSPFGRYHKHSVNGAGDVAKGLPYVERRDDLKGLTAREVWCVLCKEARIFHIGDFFDPEVNCAK